MKMTDSVQSFSENKTRKGFLSALSKIDPSLQKPEAPEKPPKHHSSSKAKKYQNTCVLR